MGDESYKANLILIILDKTCAVLSMIGSSFMGRDIVRRWNEKRATAHGRLPPTAYMLGNICVADIGYSFWAHFLNLWMVPKEEGYPMAAGNDATCAVQGKLGMFFFSSGLFLNALLAVTYWLTVCREKPESELRTRMWKGFLYVCPWTTGMVFMLASTAVVKPTDFGGMSWPYCMATFGAHGTIALKIWGIFGTMYSVSLFIATCACMGSLVQFVYKTEKQSDRFSMGGDTNNRRQTIATAKQALLYIGAFLMVLIPTIIYSICFPIAGGAIVLPNWVWIVTACMKGCQGISNSFIYFIPRYNAAKKEGGLSTAGAMSKVLNISFPSHLPCLCACPDLSKSDPKSPGVDAMNVEQYVETKPETVDSNIASTARTASLLVL